MATLKELLNSPNQSVRLKAALSAGTFPNPDQIEILVSQCANESDFFVRDTLSWALMRHEQKSVVDKLRIELKSENPQARSQALHTLSKIGDKENYELITRDLLLDSDDFVASTAWRSASALVPDKDKQALVELLISQLGRGDPDIQFGLTRFLCAIGQPIVAPLTQAAQSLDEVVRTHAGFTLIRFQEMELEKVKKK
jgi:HEAT repeat protein